MADEDFLSAYTCPTALNTITGTKRGPARVVGLLSNKKYEVVLVDENGDDRQSFPFTIRAAEYSPIQGYQSGTVSHQQLTSSRVEASDQGTGAGASAGASAGPSSSSSSIPAKRKAAVSGISTADTAPRVDTKRPRIVGVDRIEPLTGLPFKLLMLITLGVSAGSHIPIRFYLKFYHLPT
jgi:hypothetical protein